MTMMMIGVEYLILCLWWWKDEKWSEKAEKESRGWWVPDIILCCLKEKKVTITIGLMLYKIQAHCVPFRHA